MNTAANNRSSLLPVEGLKKTARRFPFSTLCSLFLFCLAIISIHGFRDSENMVGRLVALAACGYFCFGIAVLAAESRGWTKGRQTAAGFGGTTAIGLLIFLSPQWGLHLYFLVPALLLSVMVAGLVRGDDDLSFWFFNRQTGFGVAVSIFAALIWGGGSSVALASISYMFDLQLVRSFSDVWAFSFIILGPLYALYWVPRKFSFTEEECTDPPGLTFLVNWILVPLTVIYTLILYVYFGRMLVVQELPRGQLAYMITGFGAVGVVTYLIGWPLREVGGPLVKLVYKTFFPALILPIILQLLAIVQRIGQYGITEQRYIIALTTVWLGVVAVVQPIKKPPLKFIPASLAILFVLGSFGPWGGVSISGRDQFSRLEKLLTQHHVLQNGKIVGTNDSIAFEDRKNISSIVTYLDKTGRQEWLRPWLDKQEMEWKPRSTYDIVNAMGFQYVSEYETESENQRFSFHDQTNYQDPSRFVDVRGYDFVTPEVYRSRNNHKESLSAVWPADLESDLPEIKAFQIDKELVIAADGRGEVRFDVYDFVQNDLMKRPPGSNQDLSRKLENERMKVRVDFSSIGGETDDQGPIINWMQFRLFIGLK